MPHDELRNAIDALCARLQTDLQGQIVQLEESHRQATEQVRRETESQTAQEWAAKVELVKAEWQARLQSELAGSAAEAERRLAAETEQIRDEADRAAAAAREGARQEAADMADRARQEAAQSVDRVRQEMDGVVADAVARVREEMQRAADESTTRLRQEMNAATAELSSARDRSSAELDAERLKVQALTASVNEAQAMLAREREAARSAAESQARARDQQAVIEARAAERESQLAVVERLSNAMRSIGNARSLSDTLTALMGAAASMAPRAALFIVNGRELQGWRAAGFPNNLPASIRLPLEDTGLLSTARSTASPVSTAVVPAPSFAGLPADRAGIAVPVIVGGQSVAVLYADDGSATEPEAPASWPEAIQILAAHASACLAYITALRTTQAMRATAGGASRDTPPGTEEDGSARRYARLLVSEIKLYNEAAVRMGREKRDLLSRLRLEIDRARRLYEERVSPSVGARAAYFQQELVQTLADGDATLLGESV